MRYYWPWVLIPGYQWETTVVGCFSLSQRGDLLEVSWKHGCVGGGYWRFLRRDLHPWRAIQSGSVEVRSSWRIKERDCEVQWGGDQAHVTKVVLMYLAVIPCASQKTPAWGLWDDSCLFPPAL